MIPAMCRVRHSPPDTYGDCLRACVASIMERDAEYVPHFVHDGDIDASFDRMQSWLKTQRYAPFILGYAPVTLDELLSFMGEHNPDVHYILFGSTAEGGDHCVVGKGGAIVHNPAWYGCSIVGPASTGMWQIVVLVRL